MAVLILCTAFSCDNETSISSDLPISGKEIFEINCVVCHGDAGDLGFGGAADLTQSALNLEERMEIIANGKNAMMPYSSMLNHDEIEAVAIYTQDFTK